MAVIKTSPNTAQGQKGLLVWHPHHRTSLREAKAEAQEGTWRQELNPWRNAASWLVPNSLFNLLSCITQDHRPGEASPMVGWASHINQENDPLTSTQPIWWGHFLYYCSCFSDGSGFYQVDQKSNQHWREQCLKKKKKTSRNFWAENYSQ